MPAGSDRASVKKNLGRAMRLMLKPVAKLLIEQGITHQEFSETAKEVFVEMALRKQVEGGKINRSRIAIVTGLTRKEVSAVMTRAMHEQDHPRSVSRPEKVLAGWHNDPNYTGPYGMPLEIPYDVPGDDPDAPSFVNLVRIYSGDQSANQMLQELLQAGAIVQQAEAKTYRPLRRYFEPDRLSPKLIERFGDVAFNLISTLAHNIQKDSVGKGKFDRRVLSNNKLTAEELELFDTYLKERGQLFLEEIDNWLNNAVSEKDENTEEPVFDSGLAMIHYTTLRPDYKEPLQKLLEDYRLDSDTRKQVLSNGKAGERIAGSAKDE